MLTPLDLAQTNDTIFTVFLIAGIIYFVVGILAFLLGRPWGPHP